jgi:CRP/FNR family transcriptional regulator
MNFQSNSSLTRSAFPARAVVDCAHCPTAAACLVQGCASDDLKHWNGASFAHIPLTASGTALFETGDVADAVFIVRAGCIKTFTTDNDGNERVRGFHFPGNIIGLDTLGAERSLSSASAVSSSQVCRLPKAQLKELLRLSPGLTQRLIERTSHGLAQALALSGDYTADQRVAAFLLQMQDHMPSVSNRLHLPMTRRDIANYLRLATETVCRTLTRFEQKRWLISEPRIIRLMDVSELWSLAEPVGLCAPRLAKQLAA